MKLLIGVFQDCTGLIRIEIWTIFTSIKSRRSTVTLRLNIYPKIFKPNLLDCSTMSGDHKTVIKGNPSQYVKLNIGGSLHYTTIGTLTKHDTMLRAMFSGRMEVLTDSEGKKNLEFVYRSIAHGKRKLAVFCTRLMIGH